MEGFDTASVSVAIVSPRPAKACPNNGLPILWFELTTKDILVLEDPQTTAAVLTHFDRDTDSRGHYHIANVSLIKSEDKYIAVMPEDVFPEIHIERFLMNEEALYGIDNDIIYTALTTMERVEPAPLFEKTEDYSFENIEGIMTFFKLDSEEVMQAYSFQGAIHFLDTKTLEILDEDSTSSFHTEYPEGLYVMRIPSNYFDDVVQMDGCPLVVNWKGQERFYGFKKFGLSLKVKDKDVLLVGFVPISECSLPEPFKKAMKTKM
jgi:hypothetical protein